MRYRPLDANGDYTVNVPFLINTPAAVGQAAETRLRLWKGEWFADTSDGTPYQQQILGKIAGRDYNGALRQRILGTPDCTGILAYASTLTDRGLVVTATIDTAYSDDAGNTTTDIEVVL